MLTKSEARQALDALVALDGALTPTFTRLQQAFATGEAQQLLDKMQAAGVPVMPGFDAPGIAAAVELMRSRFDAIYRALNRQLNSEHAPAGDYTPVKTDAGVLDLTAAETLAGEGWNGTSARHVAFVCTKLGRSDEEAAFWRNVADSLDHFNGPAIATALAPADASVNVH